MKKILIIIIAIISLTILILGLTVIVGDLVSQKASKNAIENYKQHQVDAREKEKENVDGIKSDLSKPIFTFEYK